VDLVDKQADMLQPTRVLQGKASNRRILVFLKEGHTWDNADQILKIQRDIEHWLTSATVGQAYRQTMTFNGVDRVDVYELPDAQERDALIKYARELRKLELEEKQLKLLEKRKALVNYVRQAGEDMNDYNQRVHTERADAGLLPAVVFEPHPEALTPEQKEWLKKDILSLQRISQIIAPLELQRRFAEGPAQDHPSPFGYNEPIVDQRNSLELEDYHVPDDHE
jgi:hypothetical protein